MSRGSYRKGGTVILVKKVGTIVFEILAALALIFINLLPRERAEDADDWPQHS